MKYISIKEAKINLNRVEKKSKNNNKNLNLKIVFVLKTILLILLIRTKFAILYNIKTKQDKYSKNKQIKKNYILNTVEKTIFNRKYDVYFNYEEYEPDIITDKIRKKSRWLIGLEEAKFINGIIRKNKIKNCLEIGVADGGSSILILNAIKDIKNSLLVSLDLNKELFRKPDKLTGYRVNQYFPELKKNWKLYTGDQPHKFLVDLNIKFDFLFLDSTHVSPGEILFLEIEVNVIFLFFN